MVMVISNGLMDQSTKENGKTIKQMDLVN